MGLHAAPAPPNPLPAPAPLPSPPRWQEARCSAPAPAPYLGGTAHATLPKSFCADPSHSPPVSLRAGFSGGGGGGRGRGNGGALPQGRLALLPCAYKTSLGLAQAGFTSPELGQCVLRGHSHPTHEEASARAVKRQGVQRVAPKWGEGDHNHPIPALARVGDHSPLNVFFTLSLSAAAP